MTALDRDLYAINGGPPDHDSWAPIDLTDLPDKPPVQPTLGGIGIVYPGKRHVFSGPPESAKTLAAYAVMLNVIRQGGTAALIDFEMGSYDARARLHELGADDDDIQHVYYLEPDQPATTDRVQHLVNLQPQLVVVDAAAGAYSLQGLDDNKRADVEKLSRLYVTMFWRAGIATIFVDHVVKDTETRGRYAIGSERKLGGADVHLGFETILPISRGTTGHYKIVTHKDRGGYLLRGRLADLELSSDPETHQIDWTFRPATHQSEDTPFRPTTLMERISIWLHLQTEPVSRNHLEDSVKGTNAKAKRTALDTLIHEGFAAQEDGARGAKLVTHIHLYKKDDPACNPQTATSSDLVSTSSDGVTLHPKTTSSDLVRPRPDEVKTTSSTSSPPTGGRDDGRDEVRTDPPDEVNDTQTGITSSDEVRPSSWLDELADTVDLDLTTDPPEDDEEIPF